MKLRKLFATAAMALFVGTSAMAINPDEVRIYINPGHGAFDSGSRPMGTVKHGANNAYSDVNNDTANFFESNTNLQKAFGLMEKLIDMGVPFDRTKNQENSNPHRIGAALDMSQHIVFSRVKSGAYPAYIDYENHVYNPESDYYDRALSEISAEVEFNDFDLFISIHSNALTEGTSTNYPLVLYRGTDSQEGNPGSIAAGKACWPYLTGLGHQQWTAYKSTMNVRGDHNFYGSTSTTTFTVPEGSNYEYDPNTQFSQYIEGTDGAADKVKFTGYLGVLRHGTTGYLTEGYFHTYQPARHRYMNWDVCHLEGIGYAYGIADFFGWDKNITTGVIYGIVRDKNEKFTHQFYNPNVSTNDKYKPLNDVTVSLKKDGVEVATYKTDDEWNGAFVFHVAPGTYTIECSHPDYKEGQFNSTNATAVPEETVITVAAGENKYPEVFLENVAYEPPAKVYVNYPDSLEDKGGYILSGAYNFGGATTATLAEQLAGKTVRRQIVREDKLYVLALDAANEPYIYLADIATGAVTELDKAAVVMGGNGILKVSDIALTADHVLVASGFSLNHYDNSYAEADGTERGSVNFYKWSQNETTGLPETCELWFTSDYCCNFFRGKLGKTITYSGTLEEGTITTTCPHGKHTSDIAMRFAQFSIVDGQNTGAIRYDAWIALPNEANFYGDALSNCDDYELMVSPLGKNNFVLDGNLIAPFEWNAEGEGAEPQILGRNEKINAKVNGANYFKYAGKSLMVAPALNEEGKVVGIEMYDITNGLDNAKAIELNGATIEPTEFTYASAHGELALSIDALTGITNGAEMELFLVVDGKATKWTTAGTTQPVIRGEYAYNLAMTDNQCVYTLTFDVTGDDATDANVILTNIETGETTTIPVAVKAGANSVEVDGATLADGQYTWAIEVNGKAIATSNRIHVDGTIASKPGSYWNRGGVAIDADPESDNYGKVFVTGGYAKGIQIVDQQFNSEGVYMGSNFGSGNGSSPFRCATSEGKLYITDWSDAKSGIWVFDPANRNQITNVFDESTRKSGGEFKNSDGTVTGGGTTGVSFIGKGEDRKMFMFCEDYPSTNGQTPVGYDLGAADNWASAPSYVFDGVKGLLINTNVEVNAYEEGIFWSQIRNSGQNTSGVPSFIFTDYEGNLLFNSGNSLKDLDGSNGAGFALTNDKTICAIANGSANVNIYEFAFVDGVPTFNFLYEIVVSGATEINEICFDAANNMYVFGRGVGLAVYTLAQEAPKAVTPAKASYVILGGELTGIEDVEFDENAPVEYYNLQGIKVANPEKGIFIKKQGNKATKVVM